MIIRALSVFIFATCGLALSDQTLADDANGNQRVSESAETSEDLAAIRAGSQVFVDAFNGRDAKAVAELWTKDGEFIDDNGDRHAGRDAIANAYTEQFSDGSDAKIAVVIDSLRMVSSTVAIEDGRAVVDPPPPGAAGVSTYTATHVKENGKWLMASVRDTWVEAEVTSESLSDLGWLVGDWRAEEHGASINSTFRWVANGNFLERTFTTTHLDGTATSGVQLIGWNPLSGRVQSWSFAPDGGHDVGVWSPTATGWVSKSSGVTGDGRSTRSVNRFTRLDDDAIAWQSTERSLDGDAIPDSEEVVIKRKASKPDAQ